MLTGIHWLGHASFRIDGDPVVYVDPWKLGEAMPADIVLVTHGHHDHLSVDDIARISKPSTIIVSAAPCAKSLQGDVRPMAPGDSLTLGTVTIEAVPSYNTDKPNHPKSAGNVGYIIEIDGRRIYHAGDTDLIAEMSGVRCDIALLPMGGTYTMNAEEAAEAAVRIHPGIVVPMHWGEIVGSSEDVARFTELVPEDIEVVVMKVER